MIDIEKVKAEFLDETYIIPQNEVIYRADNKGDRYYFKVDEQGNRIIKASTTTIIKKYSPMSPFLLKWWCDKGYDNAKAVLKESSMYGTFLHILWAKLLLKYNIDMSEMGIRSELYKYVEKEGMPIVDFDITYDFNEWHKKIKQDLIGFVQWVQDYKVKPIAIEMSIVGENFSGTIDLICNLTIKNETIMAIVDWKSGRNDFYDDYVVQLEGYRQLWNEKLGYALDTEIARIFNYGCKDFRLPIGKTVTPYRFQEQTFNPACYRWPVYLGLYNAENPVLEFEKRTEIQDTVINIESDINDLIKTNDPLEFLEVEDAGNNPGQ